jgi:uncharacterized protein (DUF1330 family)
MEIQKPFGRRQSVMNSKFKMTLAALVGATFGAAAIQALHAQAKPPVYTVTEIDVTDVDAYMKEYTPVVQPIIKKAGGKLLAASLKVTALAGTAPKRVAINQWESLEQAQGLYNSPEYKEAQKIGDKYAKFRRYAVEGLPQ